jgi:nucleoside-diphosphate-sugar epimerase
MKVAVTGGTGFVGGHLLDCAASRGVAVRALTRRPQAERAGVTWVEGALDDPRALGTLVEGADAVIHVAGVINAADSRGFERGNVSGTLAMIDAARSAGVRRFVHVSSLAAREPALSLYGASKSASETLVQRSQLDWTIVRPPAVYGPGDRETLELFRMARLGLLLMPPRGRVSLIHAADLAALLLALAGDDRLAGALVEPDDARPNAWTHREFAKALARAVGSRALILNAPGALLRLAARIDTRLRGEKAKLTRDRAAYFSHDDWTVDPARGVPGALWRPTIDTEEGLAETARWYRAHGWLAA